MMTTAGLTKNNIKPNEEAIVALRGDDELFWVFFQSVQVFEQGDKHKQKQGCENTRDGMIAAGQGWCLVIVGSNKQRRKR